MLTQVVGRGGPPVVAAEEGVEDAQGGGVLAGKEGKKNDVDGGSVILPACKDGRRQFHLSSSAAEGNERKKRRGEGRRRTCHR